MSLNYNMVLRAIHLHVLLSMLLESTCEWHENLCPEKIRVNWLYMIKIT